MTLDLSAGELCRGGERIRLQDHAFRILELLVTHPGEIVSRERLIAYLWPRTTYIDTDGGLNTAMQRLRAALGDDAEAPLYVETVPRRGYRFIAPVSPAELPLGPQAVVAGPAPDHGGPRLRRPLQLAMLAVLAVLAVLLAPLFGTLGPRFLPSQSSARVSDVAEAAKLPDRNVAVLPFVNLTADPRLENLALGLSETLLHRLADVRELNVIARTSSFAFQGRYEDVRKIAHELNARYLVEGSLQESSARLRITIQLIDAATGAHVWSKTFDRPLGDIFALQDDIALDVARALQRSVGAASVQSPGSIGTENFDAWLAYEQGRALAVTRRTEDLHAAVASLERAVGLDTRFVAAHVELANAYMNEADFASPQVAPSAQAARRQAVRAAAHVERALDLDPASGEALVTRARMAASEENFASAEADFRRGLALSPNYARGYQFFGEMLIDSLGKGDEGQAMIERARLLDPLEPRGPYYAGLVELFRDNSAAGERLMIETLRIRPDYAPALVRLGWSSWRRGGRFADAIHFGEQALRVDPDSAWARGMAVRWYLELGEVEAAKDELALQPTQRASTMQIHFYEGDYQAAGELLYAAPQEFDICDIDPFVLLEHARATGAGTLALQFLQGRVSFWDERGHVKIDPAWEDTAIVAAWLLESSADRRRARQLREGALAGLDRTAPSIHSRCDDIHISRARALAALGRRAEAIAELRRGTLEDRAWAFGWYTFERDPLFASLRTDPGFEALREAYRLRVAAERVRLAQLRARGLIQQPASADKAHLAR